VNLRCLNLCVISCQIAGCITAPEVVLVDRKTALERQVGGQYPELEADLVEAGLQPGPEPFTRGQLESGGWGRQWGALGEIVQIYGGVRDDRQALDGHLLRRCVGEGRDGLLVATPADCQGEAAADEIAELVARGNRNRRQAWRWMGSLPAAAGADEATLSARWRKVRMDEAPCGAWRQDDAGAWAAKACDQGGGP